jgi:hypothetical protein
MRILLITDWNRGRGGAEDYIAGLRQGLVQAGDQVRLLTSSVGTAGDGQADYIAYGTERIAAQAFLQVANPFAIATVHRAVREFRPDVAVVNMFAHHLSPAALLPLSGTPSILLVRLQVHLPGGIQTSTGRQPVQQPAWLCVLQERMRQPPALAPGCAPICSAEKKPRHLLQDCRLQQLDARHPSQPWH